MATPAVARYVNAGGLVTCEASGSLPVYISDSVFREDLTQQLTMMGFKVETLAITSGYGFSSRDYKVEIKVRTRAATLVSNISGLIYDALEGARSYSPQVTITHAETQSGDVIRETSQPTPAPSQIETTINDLLAGLGSAGKGLGETPDKLFKGINLIVIGLVVIVGLVAFGPNIRDIAKVAR